MATQQPCLNASCEEVATQQPCLNASCEEVANQQPRCNCSREEEPAPTPTLVDEAAPLGGLRGRPVEECILTCLILLAYSMFIAGEKKCRHILTVAEPFCLYVCRGFSEMFRGLFHKQGVGGFTPERAEAENRSLKPNVVVCDRAEAKPPDGRTHWGTASPPPTSCKIPC